MIDRRALMKYSSIWIFSSLSTKSDAQGLSDASQAGPSPSEINEFFEDAGRLGISSGADVRSGGVSAIDIADTLLSALDRSGDGEDLRNFSRRGGELLSRYSQASKDPESGDLEGRSAPVFDKKEKSNLKNMFENCATKPQHRTEIDKAVRFMLRPEAKSRYVEVEAVSRVPWFIIAALHLREANLNFLGHLHNGNRLDRKTTWVPRGRPAGPWPPDPYDPREAWKLSAVDALKEFDGIDDWTIEQALFGFEKYNGWGYRYRGAVSPYVWNYSQFYTGGGYPKDGVWDPNYLSKQPGLGPVMKALSLADPAGVVLRHEP